MPSPVAETDRFCSPLQTSIVETNSVDIGILEASWLGPITVSERRHISDVLVGMIFQVLGSGTFPRDLSPFLDLLSFCLDSEWDESSQEMGEKNQIVRTGLRHERYVFAVKACTILLFLFQIKPAVPNLVVSFAHCCGSVEGGAGWILCSMINSFDDTIRGLGVRCLSSYMESTATSPDSPLSAGAKAETEKPAAGSPEGSKLGQRRIQSGRLALLAVGKGLAAMGPGAVRSIVLTPSKLTARVIYKLLWHLLKGHRTRIGKKTFSALVYLVVDDVGFSSSSLSSMDFVLDKYIVSDDILAGAYRICNEYADSLLEETSVAPGRSVRDGLGISTVMRLLRYLAGDFKDKFLATILQLAKNDRASVQILASLPDWQPCLFHLISEALEKIDSSRTSATTDMTSLDGTAANDIEAASPSLMLEGTLGTEARPDLYLELYAIFLGHCIREGGERVRSACLAHVVQ